MDSQSPQIPDLASVLRTLAAYTPVRQATQETSFIPPTANPQPLDDELEEGEYEPPSAPISFPRPFPSQLIHPPAELPKASLTPPAAPPVDPKTILTWPAALRYVTKTIARNEVATTRIRKLIENQHQHERGWWKGREDLTRKQKDRIEGRKQVNEILRSVGGNFDGVYGGQTPEEDLAEIARYDKKVHKACIDMVRATTAEFQVLGIPFFDIPPSSIIPNPGKDMNPRKLGPGYEDLAVNGQQRLKEEDVARLQKKILELLEDLCKE